MIFFDADIELTCKCNIEEVQFIKIKKENCVEDFFKAYSPDDKEYPIVLFCDDGFIIVSIPKEALSS